MEQEPDRARRVLMAGAAALAFPRAVWAGNPVVLALRGPGTAEHLLDDAALDTLPQHSLSTHTPWTDGIQQFAGVRASDVLELAGTAEALKPRQLALRALNDYTITIPAVDAWTYGTLLARTVNGAALSRRDKGPLWLVYPRDTHAELQDQRYDSRWVWQLSEIVIA